MTHEGRYCVMPLDYRHTEFFTSIEVARVAAQSFADQTGGKVINKVSRVHLL